MYMELKKLSIKNFIGDLPRIINDALTQIETAFNNVYNEEEGIIGNNELAVRCRTLEVGTDGVKSSGDVTAEVDGEVISLLALYDKVQALEEKLREKESDAYSASNRLVKKKLQ